MAGNTKTIRQDIFCRKLAQGVPLKEIYGSRATPKVITVYEWMQESAEFRTMYAVAAGLRAERLAEECLEIAGALDAESTDAARRSAALKIETRKWLVERLDAQARGFEEPDDADAPPTVEVRWVDSVAPQLVSETAATAPEAEPERQA